MQTILGSGGAIGSELAEALTEYTKDIRLVSREPEKVNSTNELISADLLDPDETRNAVKDSNVAYVTVGLRYDAEVWEKEWPVIIDNILTACREYDCKLVFFDNIYMYDKNHLDGMTEETPINPPSQKGKVRAKIAKKVMNEANEGKIQALIARSADFYGPNIEDTSMLTETVINPLHNGKKASWIGSTTFKHSFTYTPDAGKATAMLGNTDDAYDQVWHLPTAGDPLIGKEWIETIAQETGTKAKYREISKFMLKIMGLFMPLMGEIVEMYYQYDRDYAFDSSKFEKHFDFTPTPYKKGIKETIKVL